LIFFSSALNRRPLPRIFSVKNLTKCPAFSWSLFPSASGVSFVSSPPWFRFLAFKILLASGAPEFFSSGFDYVFRFLRLVLTPPFPYRPVCVVRLARQPFFLFLTGPSVLPSPPSPCGGPFPPCLRFNSSAQFPPLTGNFVFPFTPPFSSASLPGSPHPNTSPFLGMACHFPPPPFFRTDYLSLLFISPRPIPRPFRRGFFFFPPPSFASPPPWAATGSFPVPNCIKSWRFPTPLPGRFPLHRSRRLFFSPPRPDGYFCDQALSAGRGNIAWFFRPAFPSLFLPPLSVLSTVPLIGSLRFPLSPFCRLIQMCHGQNLPPHLLGDQPPPPDGWALLEVFFCNLYGWSRFFSTLYVGSDVVVFPPRVFTNPGMNFFDPGVHPPVRHILYPTNSPFFCSGLHCTADVSAISFVFTSPPGPFSRSEAGPEL